MDEDEHGPVMLALGRAIWAAQYFEMMLGSTLIALIIAKGDRSKFPDEASARKWLAQLERMALGAVRKRITDLALLPEHVVTAIAEVNDKRNEVVHHFMNLWADRLDTIQGQCEAVDYLEANTESFLATAKLLQAGLDRMRDMGLTEWKDPKP